MLLLTTVSIYVSSLNSSGLRAMLLALPGCLLVMVPVVALVSSMRRFHLTFAVGLFVLSLAVVLYFALLDHRSTERGVSRVCQQVFVMAGCLLFAAALLTLFR